MDEPAKLRASLEDGLSRGFRAFKIGWGPFGRRDRQTDEAIVKAARETVGPEILMVDAWRVGCLLASWLQMAD